MRLSHSIKNTYLLTYLHFTWFYCKMGGTLHRVSFILALRCFTGYDVIATRARWSYDSVL